MQKLNLPDYEKLKLHAELLEEDSHGEKVLRLVDGSILKLFRRKRLLSSALFSPYALRFAKNAQALQQKSIPSPTIIATYHIPSIARHAVHYHPLPGKTLRQLAKEADLQLQRQENIGHFIATLHSKGIYFRSLHLGNIIETPTGQLGLIDIADLRIYRKALNPHQRIRNLRHLLRYREDMHWLTNGTIDSVFLRSYLESQSTLSRKDLGKINKMLSA
jgi:tRNA A-37 threonylcarbamoyl transferase component Bud32